MGPIDSTTAADLLAFVVCVVGVFKFLIPQGKNQNNVIRLVSALAGTAAFATFAVTHTALHGPSILNLALSAGEEGFIAGSGGTAAVKLVHVAQDFLASKTTPATPALPTTETTAAHVA